MIFVVPLRLDDCTMPRRLRTWQYVDYFPASQQERAYQRLLQSLDVRRAQLNIDVNTGKKVQAQVTAVPVQNVEEKAPLVAVMFAKPTITNSAPIGILELVGMVLTHQLACHRERLLIANRMRNGGHVLLDLRNRFAHIRPPLTVMQSAGQVRTHVSRFLQ